MHETKMFREEKKNSGLHIKVVLRISNYLNIPEDGLQMIKKLVKLTWK